MIALLAASTAGAADPEEVEMGVIWGLVLDGRPVGTREVEVRYQNFTGERIRFVESFTEVRWGDKKSGETLFRQRLTANSHDGRPASFTSVTETNGGTVELQAGVSGASWRLAWTVDGVTKTLEVPASQVDLSTADLFDPDADLKLSKLDEARVLVDLTGRTQRGPVVPLGPSDVVIGGETLTVEGFEWRSDLGPMRFYYAANGFLVKYEQPIAGRNVVATMLGSAPRPLDDFQVPGRPVVEATDL